MISDSYDKAQSTEVIRYVQMVAIQLPDGGSFSVLDGPSQREIASFTMPVGKEAEFLRSYPRRMQEVLMPMFKELARHLKGAMSKQANGDSAAQGQLALPDMMADLGMFVKGGETVIFMGSAQFYDGRYPGFSTLNAYPDAGNARLEPAQSPFGAEGVELLPDGVVFHFCDMAEGYDSVSHSEGVQDSWLRLIDAYNGKVASYMMLTDRCIIRAISGIVDNAPEVPRTPDKGSIQMWGPRTIQPSQPTHTSNSAPFGGGGLKPKVDDIPNIDGAQARKLQDLVTQGKGKLMRVAFWDTAQEDGDQIDVIIGQGPNQINLRIELTHKEVWYTVPATAKGIEILAVSEGGGGGVTLGIRTEDGFVNQSPKLRKDQLFSLAIK
ncbi:hypothetical protein [uncultured Sulfitobacter sp.]|uniref:hypothetical protein n=1 Tax=uncultured Sulfitobacter sp. TaxID=191468 RepID=UPI0026107534|nr:hypothetical protein [uncultured Sulfitobacter sp.]